MSTNPKHRTLLRLTMALFIVAIALMFAGCGSPEELVGGPSVGASPITDVFGASTGKLPAGVTEKTLNEKATRCEWVKTKGTDGIQIGPIIRLHTDNGVMLAGSYAGLYRSENHGLDWNYVPFTTQRVIDITVGESTYIYAAVFGGNVDLAVPDAPMAIPKDPDSSEPDETDEVDESSSNAGIVYDGLYFSQDSGNSWGELIPVSVSAVGADNQLIVTSDADMESGHEAARIMVAVEQSEQPPNSSDFVEVSKIYKSFIARRFLLTANHIYAAGDTGLFRLNHGFFDGYEIKDPTAYSWESFPAVKNPFSLMTNQAGELFVGTLGSGIYRSPPSGQAWTSKSNGIPVKALISDFAMDSNGIIFAADYNGSVYLTVDNAESWHPLGTFALGLVKIEGLEFNKWGSLLAGTADGIYIYPGKCLSKLLVAVDDPRRKNRR